ncbi:YheV family putative metal-binding protein [Aestuariirhabdus sp. Z084]|uniref:YheV family putative zinc ribbon protein n=1 Tax=Aestuariirhabdus haliotis TaxID=2918751 RepID=UPI00201B4466|nr:YheV family putative zinc ribbon protein [Aestuariirhabdus haliotis]MCL6414267.1 YheV family putative metal-binding protein [Aestuariirhabdus haliotis]MCL6418199.1 YheV family putative metal-binding protein [Aestuariirhabdus haliotis]
MAIKKRFIAGAVCPSCNKMDRLVVIQEGGKPEKRECVSCGFTDSQDSLTVSEIPTRVIPKQEADAELQPLRLVSFPASTKKNQS